MASVRYDSTTLNAGYPGIRTSIAKKLFSIVVLPVYLKHSTLFLFLEIEDALSRGLSSCCFRAGCIVCDIGHIVDSVRRW